jgi:aspartyl-tRNA(Asn)/glutamyl-tRNA(Gln) amidotransferase subunit B
MFKTTIGLEVHVELKTKSKMFCSCENNPHAAEVNQNICPVCMAEPGTLPVPNEAAIESVLLFGTAVGATLADYSEFDRKNYFYPDIPKAYQISQYAYPLVVGGSLAGVELTRVHLEEDTARSQHDKGDYSLVDFNRAGVPLMELVTEPVIHSAEEAGQFARELQLLLRTIGIADANMEKGEMRVEANISVSETDEFGTKVEVKNLNSFRSVESAIQFEVKRQIEILTKGGVVDQETRGWDEQKLVTFIQRKKETAKDYRYFPDPDIPKLKTSSYQTFSKNRLAEKLPILPREKREKYSYLGLSSDQTEIIISNKLLDDYFLTSVSLVVDNTDLVRLSANYLLNDLAPLIVGAELDHCLPPDQFIALIQAVSVNKVTSRVAKDLLTEFALDSKVNLTNILTERSLFNDFSQADLDKIIASVIHEHTAVVAEFKAGKEASLQFLIGQVMKGTKGKADPKSVKESIISAIE